MSRSTLRRNLCLLEVTIPMDIQMLLLDNHRNVFDSAKKKTN